MAGTTEGGRKASITNKTRHGKDFYTKLGKLGGTAPPRTTTRISFRKRYKPLIRQIYKILNDIAGAYYYEGSDKEADQEWLYQKANQIARLLVKSIN